jgi:hypothetical protein
MGVNDYVEQVNFYIRNQCCLDNHPAFVVQKRIPFPTLPEEKKRDEKRGKGWGWEGRIIRLNYVR